MFEICGALPVPHPLLLAWYFCYYVVPKFCTKYIYSAPYFPCIFLVRWSLPLPSIYLASLLRQLPTKLSLTVGAIMPTSFTDCLWTRVNRSLQAIYISYQRGTSLLSLQLLTLQSLCQFSWWCLCNLAIFQMGFCATVLLWASHFYSTTTRIIGCPVMAHSRYFYSIAARTPLQFCDFMFGLISWVLMGFTQPSLFWHTTIFQSPCYHPQLRTV